ncbi:hypothetical protein RM531_08340 [Salinisphaera sp. P385]|uniref:Uncharacterized protein n=1 Tax=Spectribacter acetivorans TaxID=3075603 RepID=A0ABU3B7P5_9GAMM|nr:hypothetical protein [Salinisphaera sp. P385]MDT0618484.1 hypothetical protein [Salinisphaera sp. P385]
MKFTQAVRILLGEIQGEAIEVSDLAQAKARVRSVLDEANTDIMDEIANGAEVAGASDPAGGFCEAYYEAAIETARERYQSDGEIEVDEGASISKGDDPGTYVQAWVWVYDKDIGVQPYPGEVDLSFSLIDEAEEPTLTASGANLPGEADLFVITPDAIYHEREHAGAELAERSNEGFRVSLGDEAETLLIDWPDVDADTYSKYVGRFARENGEAIEVCLCGNDDCGNDDAVIKVVTFDGLVDIKNEGVCNAAGEVVIGATWGVDGGFRHKDVDASKLMVRLAGESQ